MRISDWSSDVCSSDLCLQARRAQAHAFRAEEHHRPQIGGVELVGTQDFLLCVVDLLLRPRHVHAENLRRVEQALGVVFKAEDRSEEHTSELQSLMRISYAVFCLKKKTYTKNQ